MATRNVVLTFTGNRLSRTWCSPAAIRMLAKRFAKVCAGLEQRVTLHLKLSALAVNRFSDQMKRKILGPIGLLRPTTRNTMLRFAHLFQC